MLWTSADRAAATLIWSCTEGKFNWYYDCDETIVILEGSIVLESEGMPPKRYGVGEAIFCKTRSETIRNAACHWLRFPRQALTRCTGSPKSNWHRDCRQ
jgi:hypothetical protein